jgi:undecaprenyl-diphosphatase
MRLTDSGVSELRRDGDRPFHRSPPTTPSSFYRGRWPLLIALGCLFGILAVAVAVHRGWLPLRWDLPIERFAQRHRSNELTRFFLATSRLGSTVVVFTVSASLAAVTWRRCRAVSITIVIAALARPVLEFALKNLVGRARPDLGRLVNGTGYSFPSGHVLAAIALYGLIPLVVALYTRNRFLWWLSCALSGLVVVAVAASRVYLGVHWFSDVVGSLLLGSFFLLGVEAVYVRLHRAQRCGNDKPTAQSRSAEC